MELEGDGGDELYLCEITQISGMGGRGRRNKRSREDWGNEGLKEEGRN